MINYFKGTFKKKERKEKKKKKKFSGKRIAAVCKLRLNSRYRS